MDFAEKVAVVTGSGQGIGRAISQKLADNHCSVIIAESNAETGKYTAGFIGENAVFIQTDVSSEQSIKRMIEETVAKFNRIDFLINNAAIAKNLPIKELSLEDWNKVLAVNLTAPFLCAKYASEQLAKNKGAIVNIASTRAIMSEPNTEAYSATKGGIVGLTHALAISLAPDVRVNCVSPGWIDTRDYKNPDSPTPPPLTQADHLQHLAGRVGVPNDIAEMVLYLCSDKSGFITGQNFFIDGGMTKKMIYV